MLCHSDEGQSPNQKPVFASSDQWEAAEGWVWWVALTGGSCLRWRSQVPAPAPTTTETEDWRERGSVTLWELRSVEPREEDSTEDEEVIPDLGNIE